MKEKKRLVHDALKKCLVDRLNFLPDTEDGAQDNFRYVNIVRKVMEDPSGVPLSNDILAGIEAEVDHLEEEFSVAEKEDILKVKTKSIYKRLISLYKKQYELKVQYDVEKHVEAIVKAELATGAVRGPRLTSPEDAEIYKYYLKNVFEYQLRFASLSLNITRGQCENYAKLASEATIGTIVIDLSSVETLPFTFRFNPLKPLEVSARELEDFKKTLLLYMECHAACLKKIEYLAAIIDFPKDVDGRFKYRNNLQKMFETWQRYLDAYDYNEKGIPHDEIYKKLHGNKVVSDSEKIVKSYIGYARRYIVAVERGTFPHLD